MPSSANRPENGGISFRVPEEAQGWRLDKALGLLLASPSPEQEAARPTCSRWPISAFGHAAAFATVPLCW